MKNWFSKNYKTIIILAFLIPIITVALVSISHVTKWYGISNPLTWAVYLSVGIEIAALSALAAISANMGRKVYFPFGIVTLIQFIGNIYFAYSYIDINSQSFTSWVELVSPLLEFMGVEPTDYIGHKRFLSFFAGGLLPIISLSFLHMLVKFTQGEKSQVKEEIVEDAVKEETPVVEAKDIVGEVSRVRLNDEQLEVLEKILSKKTSEESVIEEKKSLVDIEPEVQESVVEETPIINEWENEESLEGLVPMNEESPIIDLIQSNKTQIIEEPIVIELHPIDEQPQPVIEPVNEFVPALGDDEVREMVLDEWERKFDLVEDETEEVIIEPIPTSSIVEEPTPTPTTEIVVEETPIVIPIVEEHIVEEIIPEPIIEEQPIPQVEESPIIELPVENEEEKKN
jgi:hypothetical protein